MRQPAPLAFKPDIEEAAKRWDAYYAGDIIDRPIVCVTARREGVRGTRGSNYHERVYGDLNDIIDRALISAEATYYGGEAVPQMWLSFGCDEIAVFCGGELAWSEDSGDTNWSVPFIDSWETAPPLRLDPDNSYFRRMVEFHRLAAEKMYGKVLLSPIDLHSNMDLLAAARGPQRLCMDLLDSPELIDTAMDQARAVFRELWSTLAAAGRMDEAGYCQGMYSMEGAATLQCDFSCMISPAMFRRWVLPALEEEAAIVKHALYHWDGPGAVVHMPDLLASAGLHTLAYVHGDGHGRLSDYVDLFKAVQKGGKAVSFGGSPDEIKAMHRQLAPNKVMYSTWASSEAEAEQILEWFVKNT